MMIFNVHTTVKTERAVAVGSSALLGGKSLISLALRSSKRQIAERQHQLPCYNDSH
jgi:hypothetical protein